jgi:hypothetical protein
LGILKKEKKVNGKCKWQMEGLWDDYFFMAEAPIVIEIAGDETQSYNGWLQDARKIFKLLGF